MSIIEVTMCADTLARQLADAWDLGKVAQQHEDDARKGWRHSPDHAEYAVLVHCTAVTKYDNAIETCIALHEWIVNRH